MASILRIILFRCSHFGQNAGLLKQTFESHETFSAISNTSIQFSLNSLRKNSSIKCYSQESNFEDYKYKTKSFGRKMTKFELVQIKDLNCSNVTEGVLINNLQKLLNVYLNSRHTGKFSGDFINFINTKSFKDYCTVLDRKLPDLSTNSLILLLDLHHFNVPLTCSLMRKTTVLILDNLNKFTLLEKLYLYLKLSEEPFIANVNFRNIRKALDVYLKNCLETDLNYCKYSENLLVFLSKKELPLSARKAIAQKLLDEANISNCNQTFLTHLIQAIVESDCELVPIPKLLRLIETCLYSIRSTKLVEIVSSSYRQLLHFDESYYDEKIIGILESYFGKLNNAVDKLHIVQNVCLMGHYNDFFKNYAVDFCLSRSPRLINKKLMLPLLNTLVRFSFHETEKKADVISVLKIIESYDVYKKNFTFGEICHFCELSTYLGADVRKLLSDIFQKVSKDFLTTISERNVLFLHHLAKAYFSSGYEVLPDQTLRNLLIEQTLSSSCLQWEDLNAFFESRDYVLQSCTTTDNHCLNFVSLFGPNNKPINLSKYRKQQNSLPPNEYFNIAQLKKPPGSKLIIFQYFEDKQPIKYVNKPLMSGIAKMYLKQFENLDCSVVLLPPKFLKLNKTGKCEFLRTQINEILEKPESQK